MEIDSFLFPAPQKPNLTKIQRHIYLIPRNIQQKHVSYVDYFTEEQVSKNYDVFQKFLTNKISKQSLKNSHVASMLKKHSFKSALNYLQFQQTRQSFVIQNKVKCQQFIPVLFLKGNHKLIVYLHANAEDLEKSYQFLKLTNKQTGYSIIAIEYRGYSMYEGQSTIQNIIQDTLCVLQYLEKYQIKSQQIILLGRSIGSAIAMKLASNIQFFGICLLSPFISLKRIVNDHYGPIAQKLIKQFLDNSQNVIKINCPVLIIHGILDDLISYKQSLDICALCRSYCKLCLIQNMTHSKFNFKRDFIKNLLSFLDHIQFN